MAASYAFCAWVGSGAAFGIRGARGARCYHKLQGVGDGFIFIPFGEGGADFLILIVQQIQLEAGDDKQQLIAGGDFWGPEGYFQVAVVITVFAFPVTALLAQGAFGAAFPILDVEAASVKHSAALSVKKPAGKI